MPCIDPESPRTHGLDSNGFPAELGHTDSDGYYVGWIEPTGCCFEDRKERDTAIGAGRCFDAWNQWNRSGGVLGPAPDFEAILEAADVLPGHVDEALHMLDDYIEIQRMGVLDRAVVATMN